MNVLISMALLQEKQKDYAAAINSLRTAARHDPQNQKIANRIKQLEQLTEKAGPFERAEDYEASPKMRVEMEQS